MSDDMKERPAVPDGWIEFEYSDPDPDAVAEELQKQQRHKLHKPVESGVDEERGPYDVIPLAMVLGGEAKPATVYKTPMKHMVLDQGIPPRGWYKSKIEADRVRPRPCLLPDAKVNTPRGDKEIQHLQPGDIVFGYDQIAGLVRKTIVEDVTSQTKSEYLEVTLTNDRLLRLTPEHLVLTGGSGWLEAGELSDLDWLLSQSGEYEIQPLDVKKIEQETLVYDIQTSTHNFFAEGVLVHNCYTEALLTSPWGGYCPVGCSFSLLAGTMVEVVDGEKAIEDFQAGDWVLGRFDYGLDWSEVLATTHHKSPGYYHVKLSNGRDWKITAGHLVWVIGRGWVDVKELFGNYEGVKLEEVQTVQEGYHQPDQVSGVVRELQATGGGRELRQGEQNAQTKISTSGCCQEVREMRPTGWSSHEEIVREVFGFTSCGCSQGQSKWQGEQGCKEIIGDEGANAPSYAESPGQPGQRQAEIIGLEVEDGGQACCRQDGLSDQQAQSLHEQVRSDLQVPVRVGMVGGSISGQHGLELEIRERESGGWSGRVPTGFLHLQPGLVQVGQNSGSEGILSTRSTQPYENYAQVFGGQRGAAGSVDWAGAEEIEHITREVTITSMEYVEGEVDVYDIQTTSENFYASGVLVHNCYINNGSRGYRATGIPTVDPDYPEKYAKQLKRMMVAGAGYMTSFSEIFHVLEDKHHVAERLTQVFVDEGLPIFYCTRRIPMEFAVEALQKNPYSYMQFSINTSNPDDYRKLSPGAAKLEEYYKMINRLHNLGVYVSIQCNPIHPGITSLEELKQLVRELASVGTDHIIFKFVEQVMNTRKVIVDRLASRRFDPKKVDLFDKLFNQVIGGVYTIQQDMRIEWLEELLAETRANHMTMSTCYEYYENGKAGANLAPYFTTSDQCHGRGVPIHYRPAPGEKFVPLPGCYRKGCLYCADHGTRACRSETLLEAKALEYKDLVNTVITGRDEDWDMAESCARPEMEHANPNANPGYMTDAELWGWIPRYTPEDKIGQFVPAQEQHSGSKEMLDLEDVTSLQ